MIATVIYSGTDDRSHRGWRGFPQPGLQERYSVLLAAVGSGIAWTVWHGHLSYPFDISEDGPLTLLTASLAGSIIPSAVVAWISDSTGGSLLLPMVIHSLGNVPRLVDPVEETGNLVVFTKPVLAALLVIGHVVVYSSTHLASSPPDPPIPGTNHA